MKKPAEVLKEIVAKIERLKGEKQEIERQIGDAYSERLVIERQQKRAKKLTPVMIDVLNKMAANKQVIMRSTYQDSYYMASADGNWCANITSATYYGLLEREVITPASRDNNNRGQITELGRKAVAQ